jgi:hypothetical protein
MIMNSLKNLIGCIGVILLYTPIIIATLFASVYAIVIGSITRVLRLCGIRIPHKINKKICMWPIDYFCRPSIEWLNDAFKRKVR